MPRDDDLVERVGGASLISTMDLCKVYWEVLLTEESNEITAFRNAFGHIQFTVLSVCLRGAPATFQLLVGTESYADAYLDDVVIYIAS